MALLGLEPQPHMNTPDDEHIVFDFDLA